MISGARQLFGSLGGAPATEPIRQLAQPMVARLARPRVQMSRVLWPDLIALRKARGFRLPVRRSHHRHGPTLRGNSLAPSPIEDPRKRET